MVGKSGVGVMSDKDKPKDVMRSPYIDGGAGKKIRIAVSYSQLTDSLKDRLGVDLTEHELLDRINLALDRIIAHLEEITDEQFTVEDVMEWL